MSALSSNRTARRPSQRSIILIPSVNSFKKARIDQVGSFPANTPSGRERIFVFVDDQVINGIYIVPLLLQIEHDFRRSSHLIHVVADLVAPHLMNGADGRKNVEIAGRKFRQLIGGEEAISARDSSLSISSNVSKWRNSKARRSGNKVVRYHCER
jgi:hypothetical protein